MADLGPPPKSLKPGDKVSLEAVQETTWIQGEAPAEFKPGHVYIFECWATWCGPCIRSIPHLNKLHTKYADQDLHLQGMHIFERAEKEDALSKAKLFVKKRGDEMRYPVAFAPRDSAFVSHWVKPAKVRGIPAAFVVMDGILRLQIHPARITEQLVESLLKGGDEAQAKLKALESSSAGSSPLQQKMNQFRIAASKGDTEAMASAMEELRQLNPPQSVLDAAKVDLSLAKEDWEAINAIVTDEKQLPSFSILCTRLGLPNDLERQVPDDLLKRTAGDYAEVLKVKDPIQSIELLSLSGLHFRCGDKQAALDAIERAELIDSDKPEKQALPTVLYDRFRESLDAGIQPTSKEFRSWIREGYRLRAAESRNTE